MYPNLLEEHPRHFKVVFGRLRENKLNANKEINDFSWQDIEFLDHVMTNDGIKLDRRKLKAINNENNLLPKKNLDHSLA